MIALDKTLEERLEILEKEVAELKEIIQYRKDKNSKSVSIEDLGKELNRSINAIK